jgi:hypothetical protein
MWMEIASHQVNVGSKNSMELVLHHWLRRSWTAFRPVRSPASMPLSGALQLREAPFSERATSDEKNQPGDFEETVPLVSPMQ